jgi:hypothetical protein
MSCGEGFAMAKKRLYIGALVGPSKRFGGRTSRNTELSG